MDWSNNSVFVEFFNSFSSSSNRWIKKETGKGFLMKLGKSSIKWFLSKTRFFSHSEYKGNFSSSLKFETNMSFFNSLSKFINILIKIQKILFFQRKMTDEISLEMDENAIKNERKPKNIEDFFEGIFDDNLNVKINEEELKTVLFANYQQIIVISDLRNKFLEDFDQIKEKLSQSHKKISSLFMKKSEGNKGGKGESSGSDSDKSEDLIEKIDDFIEKNTQKNKEVKGFSADGPQSEFFMGFYVILLENRGN